MWNESILNEIKLPIYGVETTDDEGNPYKPCLGFEQGYYLIFGGTLPAKLKPFISSKAPSQIYDGCKTSLLEFTDIAAAKTELSDYWI